jgi:hypothetical protein
MDTLERDIIAEALAIIDRSLGELNRRELVSTSEITDLLLDVRSLLVDAPTTDSPTTDAPLAAASL